MTVTINGVEIAKESLGPLDSKTFTFKPLFFSDTATYEIVVTSEGGGLGNAQSSKTITIDKGSTTNVDFLV